MFKAALIFTTIIIVHELGHLLIAFYLKWKVQSINLYPYGGLTKFNEPLNKSIKEEIFITLAGPISQIFFIEILIFSKIGDIDLIKSYHYGILIFNLLPIYPLDGGRLINLIFQLFIPFKKSLKYIIYFSYINILFVFFYLYHNFIFSLLFILILIIVKIIKEHKQLNYYFNKFILERYLNNYYFRKKTIINNIEQFYRNRLHIINKDGKYITEKDALQEKFRKNKY